MKRSLSHNHRNVPFTDWIDGAIQLLLGALLATMPFALGVVAPWSEAIVITAVAVIALLLSARACIAAVLSLSKSKDGEQSIAWAFTPILLFIAAAAAQLLPLPASIAGLVSPHTLAIRGQLLGDLPGAAGLLSRVTVSFYPTATAHDLRLILVYSVVFLAVAMVIRREHQYVRLLWAIMLSGGAAAILALLQDLSGTDKIYWTFDSGRPAASGGPFISYSNYGQYINLCTGAALGLLLHTLRRDDIISTKGSAAAQKTKAGWQLRELANWRAWPPLAVAVLGCVTLCLSLSRGGMLSLLCAAGFTVLMLGRRRGMRGAAWVLALLLLAAFCCLLYVGFDMICDRLATLKTARDPSAGRMQTFKDILVAWRQFPLFGTGLGTHEYVYPMFDRSSDPALAEYADSDYFQALEEMGAVGLALVLTLAGYVWFCYARATRRGRPRLNVIAYGLGFGLLAVMVQSITDFGQHLPAIGCISAVFCGMLVNLSRSPRRGESTAAKPDGAAASTVPAPRRGVAGPDARWASLALPMMFVMAMAWAVRGAYVAWKSQAASDRAADIADRLEPFDWKGTDEDFARLLREASDAVAANPSDVKARYSLACYRWHIASRGEDDQPQDNAPADAAPPAGPTKADALRVIDDLIAAREVCPTFGPAYAVAGQIERLVLNLPIGSAHVHTAYALAPAHPEVCFAAAQLDATEGKFDDSLHKAQRSLALDPGLLPQVIDMYLHGVDRPDLAVAAVGQDRDWLFQLYDDLRDQSQQSDRPSVTAAMADARAAIKSSCDRADAPAWTLAALGALFRQEQDYPRAIESYRRALQKEYGQTDWRLCLANTMVEAGQNNDAVRQAEICLHLQPRMPGALKLIQDVNTQSRVIGEHSLMSPETALPD